MIRFRVDFGKNSLLMDLPTDELFDHLGSIGIFSDIPIGGTAEIAVDRYPTNDDDKIAEIVCERLLPSDKISAVNRLCERLDGQWLVDAEDFENALVGNDVRGTENICESYNELRLDAEREIQEMKM